MEVGGLCWGGLGGREEGGGNGGVLGVRKGSVFAR